MKRFFALLTALSLLLFCSCSKKGPDYSGKTFRFHLESEPQTLDPQIANDFSSAAVIESLFEGLARLDENGAAYPGAASSWSSNKDFTKFTFTIREGARWTDKQPVTAKDFVFAFRRALDPATGSSSSQGMQCIKNGKEVRSGALPAEKLGVSAPDDRTLVVELAYSYEDFPALTATTPFMPCREDFFSQSSGKYGLETAYVLGNGPFKFMNRYSWEHGKYLNLSKSATYRGQKVPMPAEIDFSVGSKTDVSNPIAALTGGTVDAIPISTELVEKAEKLKLPVVSFENTTWGLCFNTSAASDKTPNPMSSADVRRAFVQTLDRKSLMRFLPERCRQADDIIGDSVTYLGKSYRKQAGTGLVVKKDAKAAAGLPSALQKLGLDSLPTVTVLCPSDENVKHMVNEMLAEWNSSLGSYFSMEPLSSDQLSARISSGSYQIAVAPVRAEGDGPMSSLSLFRSDSSGNPALLKDSAYDALLDEATGKNGSEAIAAYQKAEKYLNDQCIFYPLYYESSYYACASGVFGIVFHPYGGGIDFISAGKGRISSSE